MSAAELADRLANGWVLCEAQRDLNEKSRLERHWLTVLQEYEAACDLAADETHEPQQSELEVAS